jgi:hypothetical protein
MSNPDLKNLDPRLVARAMEYTGGASASAASTQTHPGGTTATAR